MDINFRSRIPGCDDNDAGNLEDKICYRPADYASPHLIRRSIADPARLKRAAEPATALPRSVRELWGVRMISSVSNHFHFTQTHRAELPRLFGSGAAVKLHLPLFNPKDVPARSFTGAFIFKPTPSGPLALALAGSPRVLQAIVASDLVGAPCAVSEV